MRKMPKISSNKKCALCKKNKLITTLCKCELNFCLECRMPETHNCSFDYKNEQRQYLTKNNPLVIAEKIECI